jgi:hypothetical protein
VAIYWVSSSMTALPTILGSRPGPTLPEDATHAYLHVYLQLLSLFLAAEKRKEHRPIP